MGLCKGNVKVSDSERSLWAKNYLDMSEDLTQIELQREDVIADLELQELSGLTWGRCALVQVLNCHMK